MHSDKDNQFTILSQELRVSYDNGGVKWIAGVYGDKDEANYDIEADLILLPQIRNTILWSYEIGVKNTFFNNRLIVNVSTYLMDISDMQVSETVEAFQSYITAMGRPGLSAPRPSPQRMLKDLCRLHRLSYNSHGLT